MVVVSAALIVGTIGAGARAASPQGSSPPIDGPTASRWCEAKGGQVQMRHAFFGTNGDRSQWLDLGRDIAVCRFQADDEAHSRIYVELWTLATPTPTLATVAYLARVQNALDPAKGNPAAQDCAALGGSSSFGTGAAGGGWVSMDDPDDQVVAMCVFPDGSAIDEWGITYHSAGTIRGADLAPLLGWQDQEPLPPIFD